MIEFILNVIRLKIVGITTLLCLVSSFYGQAATMKLTAQEQNDDTNEQKHWLPVSNAKLENNRGGFILPNGIIVDINIDKQILTNGIETFSYNYQSPDNQFLMQNGQLNISSTPDGSSLTSIIQNSLDNQVISAINTINIDIRNLNSTNHQISSSDYYSLYVLPNLHN